MSDINLNARVSIFADVIAGNDFYALLDAIMINKYMIKYDLIKAGECFVTPAANSVPWRNNEYIDYSSSAAVSNYRVPVELNHAIDGALRTIVLHLFSNYLASDCMRSTVDLWFSNLPQHGNTSSLTSCLVLNGDVILKCWKAILYDFASASAELKNKLPYPPCILPFPDNEGFFVFDPESGVLTDAVKPSSLAEKNAHSSLIYIIACPDHKTINLYTRGITSSHYSLPACITGKLNFFEYLEESVLRLDDLLAFYYHNKHDIENFFDSEEGKAVLLSPAMAVLPSIIDYLPSPNLEADYNSSIFYFDSN